MKVFGIVGWKNTGKTTLVASLVRELTGRGLRVSTVKHAHERYDLDPAGTDSAAHAAAGAAQVTLVSNTRWALMNETGAPSDLASMLARMEAVDLVLVEGFKEAPHPKIECIGSGDRAPVHAENDTVVGLACAEEPSGPLPAFQRDDIQAMADFVLERAR